MPTLLLLCLNSVLQSFEDVLSHYAQQLSLNQNRTITAPSLVIVAELVCSLLFTIIIITHSVLFGTLQRSTASFINNGRTFTISNKNYCVTLLHSSVIINYAILQVVTHHCWIRQHLVNLPLSRMQPLDCLPPFLIHSLIIQMLEFSLVDMKQPLSFRLVGTSAMVDRLRLARKS